MLASNPNNEVKHEIEINSITILRELKLFFMNNKYRISEPQNCSRYNSALEMHNAELVYDEEERIHKLWVNDEPLEPKDSIKILTNMIASLQIVNAQSVEGVPNAAGTATSSSNTCIKAHAGRDVITVTGSVVGDLIINNSKPAVLDGVTLNAKEAQALAQLKMDYGTLEYTTIPGIFGSPLTMEAQYINLQMLCTDLKTKKTEESKELTETKHDEKYKDARMASVEDLFGDKRTIKTEDLFQSLQKLSDNQESKTAKDLDEAPRLLLVQGRAGIGKTIFVRYVVHQWSKGQFYANYTWVFILTLRKLRLLPEDAPALSLSEWIRQSQFSDWSSEEFEALWRQRIEPAMNQNKVLLILDGYDEVPERHPCQDVLDSLLHLKDAYQNLSLLVTSRPFGAEGISEKRRNLEIIGFIDENIHQYIQTYFLKVHDKRLIDTLTKTLRKQPVIWANAHIPLNLNLLCGIMEDAIKKANIGGLTQVPAQLSSMTRMYQVMEKKLYERSYGRHDIVSFKTGGRLMLAQTDFIRHYQKERRFLAKLAFQSFEAEHIIIPMQTIGAALQVYVDQEIAQCSQQNIQQEKAKLAEEFFEKVCRLGLIKPVLDTSGLSQTEQAYEFLHLTFQEYYTAIYLAEGSSSEDLIFKAAVEKVILREKYNPRWQIVWWFVAGLLRENAPAYKSYLEQLQGQCRRQILSHDIFEHYSLGLLTRCIDEGFEPQNQEVIEPFIKQLQSGFLKLYQTALKSVLENDKYAPSMLPLVSSPFFSACRISPNLCMREEQDLYALVLEASDLQEKKFLLEWMNAVQIVTPKVLLMLVQLLTDEDGHVRRFAVKALGQLGTAAATPQILDVLAKLLADEDVRDSAADAVGRLGLVASTPQILERLAKLLMDRNSDVRDFAAEAVGKLGIAAATPQFLEILANLLTDTNSNVRYSAIKAVGELGIVAATPHILEILTKLFADANSDVRDSAAEAVGKLGIAAATPHILETLAKLLADTNSDVRFCAAEAVGKLGIAAATPHILETLAKLLADTNSDVRFCAAEAVGKLGIAAATPQFLEILAKLLMDTNSNVRYSAVKAVGELGTSATTPKILKALTKLLLDADSNVRRSGAYVVGNLGAAAAMPEILETLAKLLTDADRDVCYSAVKAVDNLGTAAAIPEMLKALAKPLVDMDSQVRFSAAEAIGKLGDAITPQFLDVLAKLLVDKHEYIRDSAAKAVGELGTGAATPKILDALVILLADGNSDVRYSAAKALVELGTAVVTPTLLDVLVMMLMDKDYDVRYSASKMLGKLGVAAATPKILDALLGLLAHERSDVRCSATETVGKLCAMASTPKILDMLVMMLMDEDNHVRYSASEMLGKLGVAAATPKILDALLGLLAHERSDVRCSAAWAVHKLGVIAATSKIMSALLRLLTDKNSDVRCSATEAMVELGAATATPKLLDVLPELLADEDWKVRCTALRVVNKLGTAAATPQILDALLGLSVGVRKDYSATCALDKLSNVTAPGVFLDWLLGLSFTVNNDKTLHFFEERIETVFTLMPSFLAEHANHPNFLAFVSYALAAAYLNAHISCQIDFDKEVSAGHCVRVVAEKSRCCFLIAEAQAQSLVHLSSLVIEQLSKTGRLDIEELKKHLPEREITAQNSSLSNRGSAARDGGNVIHLAENRSSTLEQKGSPMLTQYQQGSGGTSEARTNQSYRELKNTCRIC